MKYFLSEEYNLKETLRRPVVDFVSAVWKAGMLTVTQSTISCNSRKYLYIFSHIKLKFISFDLINELIFVKIVLTSSVILYKFKKMYLMLSGWIKSILLRIENLNKMYRESVNY